jgi:hypothetical protein
MNLSLNGLVWRSVLKAVPDASRPNVLGTLTEFYGPKAPVGEAIRTFTSGSRMNNRANASSSIDLWREAARNSVVFYSIFHATISLGWLLPYSRISYPNDTTIQRTSIAVAFMVVGFCLQRGRYLRTAGGITLTIACATIFKPVSQGSLPNSVSLSVRVAIVVFVAIVGATFLSLSLTKRLALGVSSGVLSALVFAWHRGPIGFELDSYQMFGTVQMSLVWSAVIGWAAASKTNRTAKVWWPSVIALGLGLCAVFSWSDRFSGPIAKLVPAVLICLLLSGLALVTVRPQLFLTIGIVYVMFGMQRLAYASFKTSEWTLATAIPFVVGLAAAAIAISGSKRALRC